MLMPCDEKIVSHVTLMTNVFRYYLLEIYLPHSIYGPNVLAYHVQRVQFFGNQVGLDVKGLVTVK